MKTLLVFDKEDYTKDMPVVEKKSVRAVICKDGRLAVQMGAKGDCKILGGGIEQGEDDRMALMREVREEAGLIVSPGTIREFGEVVEKRRDMFDPQKVYMCRSFFYFCGITEERVQPQMTKSEIAKGYHLAWLEPQEVVDGNQPFLAEPWIYRDTEFVRKFLVH